MPSLASHSRLRAKLLIGGMVQVALLDAGASHPMQTETAGTRAIVQKPRVCDLLMLYNRDGPEGGVGLPSAPPWSKCSLYNI